MMIGDYTKVPLRPNERWTGARMQQGRVLLDHDWNLNLDATARNARAAISDAVGPAGVLEGSDAFKVAVTAAGELDLTMEPGRIWVDGLMAHAPAAFTYSSQAPIESLPGAGRALVYLDVFEEHVQPAEAPQELVDPALSPVDSAARTRVGWRVRAVATAAATCKAAVEAFAERASSSGRLTISRDGVPAPPDPCDPPGDPLGRLPDGLLRVEVLDRGDAGGARFGWSFENGGASVGVSAIAGTEVTLLPSQAVKFADGDTVEVSWLERRADRADHGALFEVAAVAPGAGGDVLTLDRAPNVPDGASGLAIRRWDGEFEGADVERQALLRGADIGIRFQAVAGDYEPGDWWGARLREGNGAGVEERTDAAPDGTLHAFAPLALVDLDARTVLSDCRPTFRPLTELEIGGGACTVVARPGDDLQAAIASLPESGGELCLAAGTFTLDSPLLVEGRRRVTIVGTGPATVLRAAGNEAAVVFDGCSEVEVRHLRAEGGSAGAPPGNRHLNGALTFVASTDIGVSDCVISCPESAGLAQACITVRSGERGTSDRVRIERNRLEIGAWQTGILVVDAEHALVAGNHLRVPQPPARLFGGFVLERVLDRVFAEALRREPGEGVRTIELAGAETLNVLEDSPAERLVRDFADSVSSEFVERRGGASEALRAWARAVGSGSEAEALSAPSRELLLRLRRDWHAALQGIVVAGRGGGSAQILDNVVEDAIQGIHVGASGGGGEAVIDEVTIRGNSIAALVPSAYNRERHGIFVGNARTIQVLDTVATLRRSGAGLFKIFTPVEGIRIHGRFGPFLSVRGSSLQDFSVGVRVVPLVVPKQRLWVVTDTMAAGAAAALDAPVVVERERNVP